MSSNRTPKKEEVAGPTGAALACGCRVVFHPGSDESPLLVVVEHKAESCGVSLHVAGLPVYDRRAAMRPSTRVGPPLQPDFEDG
ncbi:MAG TPA: hypothetical protein VN700_05650 [Vicinamibacterales bacterium]|nr:hypothetical protein [Vicinamibacterales bacterium]